MHASSQPGARSFARRLLVLGAALTLLSCALWWIAPIREINRRIQDTWFNLRTEPRPSSRVALVLIDDVSLQRYGRWPWSRTLLADLVNKISVAQPEATGFDILLPEVESESADASLERAFLAARNVVLVDKISGSGEGQLWIEPLPRFAKAAVAIGHAQALLDSDGVCRRFPLAELSLEGPRLAFAEEVAYRADPRSAAEFQRFHESIAGESLIQRRPGMDSVAPILAPIDFRAETRDTQSSFLTVAAADVFDGRASEFLRGKVVMVGFGSSDIHDRLVTPVSGTFPTPGVEIHAHIVDAILSHRFLAPMPLAVQFALLVLASFLSVAAGLRYGVWRGLAAAIVIAGLIYFVGSLAFVRLGRQIDAGVIMLSAVLAIPMVQIDKLLAAERSATRQLRQIRSSLAQSSPTPVSGDVNWKLQTLEQLQTQLAAAYEFEHALLETSHDRIAVFSDTGRLLFCNSAFEKLWRLAHIEQSATLEGLSKWIAQAGALLDIKTLPLATECLLDGNLYNLRLTRVPTAGKNEESVMLVMTDLQARMERDRTRAETLAFVTHELRTPLISIQGFAEMMARLPNNIPQEAPETIFRESRRLVALINSYLDVLRLDSGARPLRMDTVDANGIAEHVVRVLEPVAHARDTELLVIADPQSPAVYCDEALITGALINLGSNAIKYGGERATVRISVQSADRDMSFAVWNSGPPIPAEDTASLFDPFFRGAAEHNRQPGWGLGLAFVKRMIDQHNGNIFVASSAATGTEFRIVLPGAIRSTVRLQPTGTGEMDAKAGAS